MRFWHSRLASPPRRNSALAVVLLLTPVNAVVHAAGPAGNLETALRSAGKNRPQIEAAIAKVPARESEGMRFLVANMPDDDLKTLTADFLLENVDFAYRAWDQSSWKERVPKDVFLNYILPYAVVDEQRDNWRKNLYERFRPLVDGTTDPAKATIALNEKLFSQLKVRFSADRKRANQSPLETIDAGKASCTGLSILLVDACRAVGVPARLVGTPLWTDKSGNHSWVEIWDGSDWHFTGAAEPTGANLDQGWFAGRATTALRDDPLHAIYAARFERGPLTFPPAWSRRQGTVYALNVTDRYLKHAKPRAPNQIVVRLRMLDERGGSRVAAKLRLTGDNGLVVAEGETRDDRFDPNDHFEAVVERERPLDVQLSALDRHLKTNIKPTRDEELFTYYLSDAEQQLPRREKWSDTEQKFARSLEGKRVSHLVERYFATKPEDRDKIEFDPALDGLVLTHSTAVRKLAWQAYAAGQEAKSMREELASRHVRYQTFDSPYVLRPVGCMPPDGWPLVIAMHGGGGAPADVNDSQWRVMQHYYRDQPSAEGYLYLAIRAPNNDWNGFYAWYNLGLTDRLIRQFIACEKVDPNKVYLIGYSHGGYGAFYIGPRMPDRFAAIHASAAAPTDGNSVGKNLRNTPFTFMIGEHDLAHNRLPMCRDFEKYINTLRGDRHDIYPVAMEFKEGYQHSGLPDRDKIKDLLQAVRLPVPRELDWVITHKEVGSLNWLHVPEPADGMEVSAKCHDNALTITTNRIRRVDVLLDERLATYNKPLEINLNGRLSSQRPGPSLRTLCETLAERGDPELSFATRLTLSAGLPEK